MRLFIIILSLTLIGQNLFPQSTAIDDRDLTGEIRTITTAVPFLMVGPDSRSGGLGDAGVATSPDANSMHWNPAKYAFAEKDMSISISYTPWLSQLVDDINLAYIAGYKRFDRRQVVGASLTYFSLGNITFTNEYGDDIGQFKPNEFSIDGCYSRIFGPRISGGVSLRYIYSNLTGGQYVGNLESHPGQAISSDVSAFYQNKDIKISDKDAILAVGVNMSNIGSKISYTENAEKDFIPINLRLGAALTMELDDYNTIMFTGDVNKLMVPTPPKYYQEGDILPSGDTVNVSDEIIKYGEDPDVSVPVGMFRSFWDAPGIPIDGNRDNRSVFKEEIREFTYSLGVEYWYAEQFALRAGYFHEHETKGNREFFTVGLGLKLNVFGLNFSYLIPTSQRNPLENTLRFSLIFDFEGLEAESEIE